MARRILRQVYNPCSVYILASVSLWPLLIIELVARAVPEHIIIRLMELQMREKWNFLHHPFFLKIRGRRMKFIIMQMIEIATL